MTQYYDLILCSTIMGMFDQIRITRTMPDGYQSNDWYQTKSMECLLVDYEVDNHGQLWELGVCTKPDPDGKQKLHYTGEIVFYDNATKSYCALFDNGILILLREVAEL